VKVVVENVLNLDCKSILVLVILLLKSIISVSNNGETPELFSSGLQGKKANHWL
jgi:hypothetical protein